MPETREELLAEIERLRESNQRLRETLVEIERLSESPSWDDPSAGVGPIARAALVGSGE